jgi:hypothetical protein
MRLTSLTRTLGLLAAVTGAALTLAACTYVERERTPPTTVVTPPAQPTVVAPAPSVTVRPSY